MKLPSAFFVYDPDEINYRFNERHPFNQHRIVLTVDLLKRIGALQKSSVLAPEAATEEELRAVHSPEYIEAVKALSAAVPPDEWTAKAERYGLTTEDTPFFEQMHDVTSRVVGGSLLAAETVMSGRAAHALHLPGGLHHALQSRAAGFCVYNDAAVAIAHIRRHHGARILYVDTDVHHGDGVQWSFYEDPDVCTFSIHETGKYLFPSTGGLHERGDGEGFGACINLPMEPYTEDESWLECFREGLERVIASFRPDVIVSQHGCDAHAFDPLAHIHCSMRVYLEMPKLLHKLAHEYCGGRWIALGGGGYDIWRVVPRAWSLLWLVMSDHPLVSRLERHRQEPLPASWLARWKRRSPMPLPQTWLDEAGALQPIPRRDEIAGKNRQTTEYALQYLPPLTK